MNLTCIIPAETLRSKDINIIIKRANKIKVNKLIVISTNDVKYKVKFNGEYIFLKTTSGTKISKLKLSNDYISDDEIVFVLDADDLLNPSFKWKSDFEKNDLILIDYFKKHRKGLTSFKYNKVSFDKINYHWNKNGTPYFGNHSMMIKGWLFKLVNSKFMDYDFQRHEDAVRSLFYISYSNSNIFAFGKNRILIKRRNWNFENSASRRKDELIIDSIIEINRLLSNLQINFSKNDLLRKSQLSSINEIYLTTKRLVDKGVMDNKFFLINDPLLDK